MTLFRCICAVHCPADEGSRDCVARSQNPSATKNNMTLLQGVCAVHCPAIEYSADCDSLSTTPTKCDSATRSGNDVTAVADGDNKTQTAGAVSDSNAHNTPWWALFMSPKTEALTAKYMPFMHSGARVAMRKLSRSQHFQNFKDHALTIPRNEGGKQLVDLILSEKDKIFEDAITAGLEVYSCGHNVAYPTPERSPLECAGLELAFFAFFFIILGAKLFDELYDKGFEINDLQCLSPDIEWATPWANAAIAAAEAQYAD
ncbi:hypothetical protein Q8F55_003403 [Vanrija albida]|uniref:NmrA-like domain-containing protein n=1 Tax=Vanrija albida TaxID=181172 RepID=A0ABR3Q3V2_9TREE